MFVLSQIFLMILMIMGICIHGQDLSITLKPEKKQIKNAKFFIQGVEDGRSDKSQIGTAQIGLFNKRVSVHLSDGVEKQLLSYFNTLLPEAPEKTPIWVRVNELSVNEKTSLMSENATATAVLSFYKITSNDTLKIHQVLGFIQKTGMDVTQFHEPNLRSVLLQCVEGFLKIDLDTIQLYQTPRFERAISVQKDSLMIAASKMQGETRSLLVGGTGFGNHTRWYGGSYISYNPKEGAWIWPFSYSLDIVDVNDPSREVKGTFTSFGFSLIGLRRIKQYPVALMFSLGFPFGTESIKNDTSNKIKFIFGVQSYQALVFLPNKTGLFLAGGIYESAIMNSTVYPKDFGYKFLGGFQF